MTSQGVSQCSTCVRFVSPLDRRDGFDEPTCEAFPGGIPGRVYGNGLDHRLPIDGDQGVHWESNGLPFPDAEFADGESTLQQRLVMDYPVEATRES